MCAVLPRVKGSLSDEVTLEQRPERGEPGGQLGKEFSRPKAKTLRQEVCVRTKANLTGLELTRGRGGGGWEIRSEERGWVG